jgi:hypothetical protein
VRPRDILDAGCYTERGNLLTLPGIELPTLGFSCVAYPNKCSEMKPNVAGRVRIKIRIRIKE